MKISDENRQNSADELYIGIMSGTSLDGVDAVLADFVASPPKLIATHFLPYPQGFSSRLLALQKVGGDELHQAAVIGNEIVRLYHDAVEVVLEKACIKAESVLAVGCHGQTIRHNPHAGYSLQLGNPALLAELCGINVVADFRSRDIAAGGQGAPLVPAFHEAVFRVSGIHRVILNLGGIANVTNLAPGAGVTGFDTGPGNMLLDAWVQRHSNQLFDENGNWASRGHVIPGLLDNLLSHPFINLAPPKSCGREQFNIDWLESVLVGIEPGHDVQATLLEYSAKTISSAIECWCGLPDELVVCGGGAHNLTLLKRLSALLPQTRVMTSDMLGIGADWVEAMAFAWLARQAMRGHPGNLSSVTGAKGARILGAIHLC
ncbi:MAG: anhydro-N-acetylmuramic acid kinase [Betaproteobacteria bacterium]|nr:anhydro-N-acetylmuramic acid kinase [Betaproteobacteria bacterium]